MPTNLLCPSQATQTLLQTPNGLAENPGLSLLLITGVNARAEGHSAGKCRLQDLTLHLPDLRGCAHFIPCCLGRRGPSLRVSSCFSTFPTQSRGDNGEQRAPPRLAATVFRRCCQQPVWLPKCVAVERPRMPERSRKRFFFVWNHFTSLPRRLLLISHWETERDVNTTFVTGSSEAQA